MALLGRREPEHYGTVTLATLEASCIAWGERRGVEVVCGQAETEAELAQLLIAAADKGTAGIALNAAAFTHTSVMLRDTLSALGLPFVEVHLSNVFARESFRHKSYFADLALGVVSGLGVGGYIAALEALYERAQGRTGA